MTRNALSLLWLCTLRRVVTIAALLAASGTVAHAQATAANAVAPPTQPARPQGPPTLGGFELTADQKLKIDSIDAKHSTELKAVGALFSSDPAEGMRRMIVLRTKMQKEVRVLLTTDQRAIYDRNMAEMNAQMDAHLQTPPR